MVLEPPTRPQTTGPTAPQTVPPDRPAHRATPSAPEPSGSGAGSHDGPTNHGGRGGRSGSDEGPSRNNDPGEHRDDPAHQDTPNNRPDASGNRGSDSRGTSDEKATIGDSRSSGPAPGATQADWEAASVRSGLFTEGDLPRLRELAAGDPAHRGSPPKHSNWEESEVGLGLENQGAVRGLRRSTHPAEEFIDSSGQAWDVKAFRGDKLDLDRTLGAIYRELHKGENLMLDTRNLSTDQFMQLYEAVRAAGYSSRVLWWP